MREPLSTILKKLVDGADDTPRTLNGILGNAGKYGVDLVIIVLALPFCLPILPGVSAPFGMAIIILAFRQIIHRPGRLPKFIGDREFAPDTFEKIIKGGVRILDRIERFSSRGQRRLPQLANTRFNAFLILLMGVVMALPIPFPATNTFPAWAIVFLATAQAEEDGVLVLWGYAAIFITIGWFWFWWKMMWLLMTESYEYLKGIF
jgi:hypothetical protein